MFKFMRRAIAMALAASLVVATPVYAAQSPTTAPTPVVKDDAQATDGSKVDTAADGTAALVSVPASTAKSVKIASTVTVDGVTYTVTTLEKGALKALTKAKTITLPETITELKKGSIQAGKLKTLKLTSKKAPKIEKGAFKGKNTKKMTIKVSKKKMSKTEFKKLQKRLKKAGFKGKVVRK